MSSVHWQTSAHLSSPVSFWRGSNLWGVRGVSPQAYPGGVELEWQLALIVNWWNTHPEHACGDVFRELGKERRTLYADPTILFSGVAGWTESREELCADLSVYRLGVHCDQVPHSHHSRAALVPWCDGWILKLLPSAASRDFATSMGQWLTSPD